MRNLYRCGGSMKRLPVSIAAALLCMLLAGCGQSAYGTQSELPEPDREETSVTKVQPTEQAQPQKPEETAKPLPEKQPDKIEDPPSAEQQDSPDKPKDTPPAGQQDTPGKQEDTPPAEQQDTPDKQEDTPPTEQQDSPGKQEDIPPAGQQDTPGKQEDIPPAQQQDSPSKKEDTPPTEQQDSPDQQEDTPPAQQQDSPGEPDKSQPTVVGKPVESDPAMREIFTDRTEIETVELQKEADSLSHSPAALPDLLLPQASGTDEKRSDRAVIDYSHTADGYVMVKYIAAATNRLKVQIKGPNTTYTYNLTPEEWEVFPLSDGSGAYQITVYENVTGTKYALVLNVKCQVTLADEFAPFLRPNQYVDYADAVNTVSMGAELTAKLTEPLEKVDVVYDYVVQNLTYDKERAATVKSGYLPDLDAVLREKKGICFDYAALMTAMLRSQGIPCKLVVGYAGTAYHAWISVWTEAEGWVDGVIYFDGRAWHRMDPTFASSGQKGSSIMAYIGDGTNYTVKYLY